MWCIFGRFNFFSVIIERFQLVIGAFYWCNVAQGQDKIVGKADFFEAVNMLIFAQRAFSKKLRDAVKGAHNFVTLQKNLRCFRQ